MPKPSSIGNVLTKGSVCVPCSPIVQALAHSESDLCHKECNVILNLSSSPTHCVDLDKTLVPIECKCALHCSCHMGFDLSDHHDCVSRKEYASLLHQVEAWKRPFNTKLPKAIIPCCLVMVHMVPHQMSKTTKPRIPSLAQFQSVPPVTVIAHPLTQSA